MSDIRAPARRSNWGQLWHIFVAPGRAFAVLAENHGWLPAWLASGAVGMVAGLAALPATLQIGMEAARRAMAERAPQATSAMGTIETIQRITLYITATLGPWLAPLFDALLLGLLVWFVSLVGKDAIGFDRSFGLAMWAALPAGLMLSALRCLWLLLTPTDVAVTATGQFNSSLALLVPSLARSGWAFRLLSTLDIFSLWTAVLVGMGYLAFSRRSPVRAVIAGTLYWAARGAVTIYGLIVAGTVLKA